MIGEAKTSGVPSQISVCTTENMLDRSPAINNSQLRKRSATRIVGKPQQFTHLRVCGDQLRHLLCEGVRGRLVATAGRERHTAHGKGERLAGEVGKDAVEGILDIRKGALLF